MTFMHSYNTVDYYLRAEDGKATRRHIELEDDFESYELINELKSDPSVFVVKVDNHVVEKHIASFEDAMEAWDTNQLDGKDLSMFMLNYRDVQVAYDAGAISKSDYEDLYKFFSEAEMDIMPDELDPRR